MALDPLRTFAAVLALVLMAAAGPARADGQEQYANLCSGCHQANGSGVAGMFPPLASRLGPWFATPEGREYVAQVVLNGRYGDLIIDGQTYSGFMPTFGHLENQQIADILNYVAQDLNPPVKSFEPYSAEAIAKYKASPKRDAALMKLRNSLPGGGS
jgi:mono/diheme cytochrome c family protein